MSEKHIRLVHCITRFPRTVSPIQNDYQQCNEMDLPTHIVLGSKNKRRKVRSNVRTLLYTLIIFSGNSGGRTWLGLCTRPRPAARMTHIKYVSENFCFKILCNHNSNLYTYVTKKNSGFAQYDLPIWFTRFSRDGKRERGRERVRKMVCTFLQHYGYMYITRVLLNIFNCLRQTRVFNNRVWKTNSNDFRRPKTREYSGYFQDIAPLKAYLRARRSAYCCSRNKRATISMKRNIQTDMATR